MSEQQLDRRRAPLLEALLAHRHAQTASFHVPGHKSGQGVDAEAAQVLASVMSMDFTELSGLDDLNHAEGVIREAQELAAACFGAEETFFLIGGSTVGNLAMITTVCQPGDVLIVQRNAHKSVIHGLMLAGARAVFVQPEVDEKHGIAGGVSATRMEQALAAYPEAKALFVTSPTYYGAGADLKALARLAHGAGKLLLVDEAHGAHLGFHEQLPPSALSCGADVVVQSTHKMLTAMTMAAMLHVQGERIDRGLLRQRLTMLQSSSPSYPLLASLDAARRQLHTGGRGWVDAGLQAAKALRVRLAGHPRFCEAALPVGAAGFHTVDPFKVTVYDAAGTLTGPALREQLEARGCHAELADPRHVLLVFSPASRLADAERLYAALCSIAAESGGGPESGPPEGNAAYRVAEAAAEAPGDATAADAPLVSPPSQTKPDSDPPSLPVAFALPQTEPTAAVPLAEAVGRRSAELVTPYPPGVPHLYPSETITAQAAETLRRLVELGIVLHGTDYAKTGKLKIFLT